MSSDATPAYRGYRLQALYVLWRILESNSSENLIFQPEGYEDLSIFEIVCQVVCKSPASGRLVDGDGIVSFLNRKLRMTA